MIRRTLAALALLAITASPIPAHAAQQQDGTVVAILAPDTVAVRFPGTYAATTIRLIGVEVPKGDECGRIAMLRALDALALGKVVTVEFAPNGPLHARDGATRAYLWLGAELDEEYTIQEMAGAYADQECRQPKYRI